MFAAIFNWEYMPDFGVMIQNAVAVECEVVQLSKACAEHPRSKFEMTFQGMSQQNMKLMQSCTISCSVHFGSKSDWKPLGGTCRQHGPKPECGRNSCVIDFVSA